jgi:hypothetical protein
MAIGEEENAGEVVTTMAVGEEEVHTPSSPTTTTLARGEEEGRQHAPHIEWTTLRRGEEDAHSRDDHGMTTMAVGEEDQGGSSGGSPFGSF